MNRRQGYQPLRRRSNENHSDKVIRLNLRKCLD